MNRSACKKNNPKLVKPHPETGVHGAVGGRRTCCWEAFLELPGAFRWGVEVHETFRAQLGL
jgi:hypothetical protein